MQLFFTSDHLRIDELFVCGVHCAVTCYSLSSVLEAFGLTCAVTAALTVYTLQSKRDFSSWGAGWVDRGKKVLCLFLTFSWPVVSDFILPFAVCNSICGWSLVHWLFTTFIVAKW